ncbi:unnamed protein product, partial [Hymenolepis diminuta]
MINLLRAENINPDYFRRILNKFYRNPEYLEFFRHETHEPLLNMIERNMNDDDEIAAGSLLLFQCLIANSRAANFSEEFYIRVIRIVHHLYFNKNESNFKNAIFLVLSVERLFQKVPTSEYNKFAKIHCDYLHCLLDNYPLSVNGLKFLRNFSRWMPHNNKSI